MPIPSVVEDEIHSMLPQKNPNLLRSFFVDVQVLLRPSRHKNGKFHHAKNCMYSPLLKESTSSYHFSFLCPFVEAKCQTSACQHCSQWECSSASVGILSICPPHYFALWSLPRRVLNSDDNAALKTNRSGTTVIGFIHTAGKISLDDCSCQSSLVRASIRAIDLAGKHFEFLYQATETTRLFWLSFSVLH